MKLTRRALAGLAGAVLATMSLGQSALAQKQGGTLVMVVQPEPPTLASYLSTSGPIGMVAAKVFDGLLEYDLDLKPLPSLAESWEVAPDGMQITFNLRQGVTFHDGKPLTAADVQFSIMNVAKVTHPRGPNTFAAVTAVETPNDHTVVLKLSEAAPYMMMAFSGYETPIIPKHVYGTGDLRAHPNANQPIGSGPFKFVEWKKGQYIRLDRNPSYWKKGQPYLDRIVARFIADPSTRTAALEKGEAHFAAMGAVPFNDAKKLAENSGLTVTTRGHEMFSPLAELLLNTTRKPLDDKRVRQAIAYAMDRQFIIDNIWFGYGKPATGPMSSNFAPSGLYTADVQTYEVADGVDRANKILDEAGYAKNAEGVRFELMHDSLPYGQEWTRFGEYVQQALGKIGIKVTIRQEDVARWLKRTYHDHDFDTTANYLYNLADPVIGVHRAVHSKTIKPGTVFTNGSYWSSPRTDELLDKAKIEPDATKRAGYYAEVLKIVAEEIPIIWIHEMNFPTVVNNKFADVIVSALGVYSSFDRAYMK
ncbi:MAG: ABC transporter substrate-binding protein [Ectothiorhodospiraceae bacterium]|nr:ABC transporter substrate-binding protein [Ectothiorhodospiraceae bacterium]